VKELAPVEHGLKKQGDFSVFIGVYPQRKLISPML